MAAKKNNARGGKKKGAAKKAAAKETKKPAPKAAAKKTTVEAEEEPLNYDRMRKQALVELCVERELEEEGTADELRERLREDDDNGDGTSTESTDSLNLGEMRKPGLIKLCTTYGLGTGGTAEELRKRLEDAIAAEKAAKALKPGVTVKSDGTTKAAEDPEDWSAVIASRIRGLDVNKIHPSWSDTKSLLTPALWPLLLDTCPLKDTDVFNRFNQPGEELRGLQTVWKTSWRLSDAELMDLTRGFQDLHTIIRVRPKTETPRGWALRNWDRHVAPLVAMSLRKQACLVSGAASRRLTAMANTPWHVLGYDAGAAMYSGARAAAATDEAADEDFDDVGTGPTGHGGKRKRRQTKQRGKVTCRTCKKQYALGDLSVGAFFAAHNKSCK